MDNMRIYAQVRAVPEAAKKKIAGGRLQGMTDINPMWRIKCLTEIYGPCGQGWRYAITKREFVPGAGGEIACFTDLILQVRENGEWGDPIPGTGGAMYVSKEKAGLYTDDEAPKKALTDALSVACKALGVGADVYFARDATKYDTGSQQDNASFSDAPETRSAARSGAIMQDAGETHDAKRRGATYERPNAMRAEGASAAKQDAPETRSATRSGARGRITAAQVGRIKMMCTPEEIGKLCEKYSVSEITDLGELTAAAILKKLEVRNGVPAQGDAG